MRGNRYGGPERRTGTRRTDEMKMPYISKDAVLNAVLVVNIIAFLVGEFWFDDLITLNWFLRSALAIHLVLRWPRIFYHRNGWKG